MLKIERATEHLQSVREVVGDLSYLDPDTIIRERDSKTGEQVVRVRSVRQPPPRIGIFTGDTVQNYRAALDHLAWQLVKHPATKTGEQPAGDREICFPIYADDGYTGREIRGSTPSAQAIIQALQPYHAGEKARSHPLWLLRELSNWDKHRVLHAIANTLIASGILQGEEGIETARFAPPGILQEGAELARYKLRTPLHPEMNVKVHFTVGVTFADGPAAGRSVDGLLADISKAVIDTLISLFNGLTIDADTAAPPPWANFL